MHFHNLPPEPRSSRPRALPDDAETGRAYVRGLVLAVVGAAICALGLWLTWGVVPWVVGAALFGLALIGLTRTWRTRRWVTVGAAVIGVAVVGAPFVLPYLERTVPVEWSVAGEWPLTSSSDLVVTASVDPREGVPPERGDVVHLRARTAASGDVVWSREVEAEDGLAARVHRASGVLVVWATTDPGHAWEYRAYDMHSGDDLWTSPAGARIGMVAASGDLLIMEGDGRLEGWDARTGEVRWSEAADFRGPRLQPHDASRGVDYVGLRVPAAEKSAADVKIRVLDAMSGESVGGLSVRPGSMVAVVGDRLVVDDGATAAASEREIGDTDYVRVNVTSYALPALDEMWSAELARPKSIPNAESGVDPFGTGHSYTVTPGGVVELVAPTDGAISRIPSPRGVRLTYSSPVGFPTIAKVQWSEGGHAIMPDAEPARGDTLLPAAYVDLDEESARTVDVPSARPEASLPGDDGLDPAPLWRGFEDDLFGRTVPHAYVVDDADGELSLRDVGALPNDAGKVTAHAGMLFTRTDNRLHAIDPGAVR